MVYSATFTPNSNSTSQGLVSVGNFKFSDAAGNANEDGAETNNSLTFIIDTIAPTISIHSNKTFLGLGEHPRIFFNLSEPSTNFDISDISVNGGSLYSFTGSGNTYSALLTPNSTSNISVQVFAGKFTDTSGNFNSENSSSVQLIPFDPSKSNVTWTRLIGTESSEIAYGLSLGGDGSIYVAGVTTGNLDGQKNNGNSDIFLAKYNLDGSKGWTKLLGTSGSETAGALTTGLDGAIYICGSASGDLNGQVSSVKTQFSTSSDEIVVAKYAPDGTLVWTRLLGTTSYDYAYALTTGLDGSIYVSGATSGNLENQTFAGSYDSFLTKFTPDGVKVWTQLLGTKAEDYGKSLAKGLDGSIYLSGSTTGNLDGQNNAGGYDCFITKYSSNGEKIWTRLQGSFFGDFGKSVTIGQDGSIYVTGDTEGSFDGQTSSGKSDVFLTKYSPDGTKIWTQLLGNSSHDYVNSIITGLDSSIYLSGYTLANLDGQISNGGYDAFLLKLTAPNITAPQLTLNTNKSSLSVGATADIIFTLSKPSTNFVLTDISVTGGTLSNFQGSGLNYSALFTASIDGVNGASVSVGSGKFSDALGIFNEDGADLNNKVSFTVTVPPDTTPPSISIASETTSFSASQTAKLIFTLSEVSTNFTASDIAVVGGTLSNFKGSGSTYEATFSFTIASNSNASISVPSGVFSDSAGNVNNDGAETNNTLIFIRLPTITNETHNVSVIVDKNVLGSSATLLKELKESITYTNGAITKHSVEYNGMTFDYDQIDYLITTVARDGDFTAEFTKEINDYLGTELNIAYSSAVKLVGATSIDAVILSVAGADGNYVG
jgi:hypothetical protein